MNFKNIIIILISLYVSTSFALEGEIVPSGNKSLQLEEGSTFDGIIRMWPFDQKQSLDIFSELKEGKISENIFLVQKYDVARSSNNSDVVEISGLFAIIKAFKPNTKIKIKLNDFVVNTDVRKITTVATAPPPQEFEFVSQPDIEKANVDKVLIYISPVILIVLILIAFLYKKAKAIKKRKEEIKKTKDKISIASNRSDLEELSKMIPQYKKIINLNEEEKFQSFLEEIQYKPNWSQEELEKAIELKERLFNGN